MRTYPALAVIGMTSLGIMIAYIIDTLNSRGILVDEIVSGSITVTDLMIVVILVFMLAGVLMGVRRR